VPAGAVAIAAGYSAVYPSESPGGWHLIGHTDLVMWDPGHDRPAAIRPGDAVRFVVA
jgi:5-oxoprolinase (ATP-hydrolysing) subunit B